MKSWAVVPLWVRMLFQWGTLGDGQWWIRILRHQRGRIVTSFEWQWEWPTPWPDCVSEYQHEPHQIALRWNAWYKTSDNYANDLTTLRVRTLTCSPRNMPTHAPEWIKIHDGQLWTVVWMCAWDDGGIRQKCCNQWTIKGKTELNFLLI